ncbi:hypothetical protein L0F63_006983 [Massospora cicadina]|nr:hypothetical protein L0F63_006983 [Massospora cicadina]
MAEWKASMLSIEKPPTELGIKPHDIHPRVGVIRYAEGADEHVHIINVKSGFGDPIRLSPCDMGGVFDWTPLLFPFENFTGRTDFMNDELLMSSLARAIEMVPILTGHLERIDGTPVSPERNTDMQVIVGTRGVWFASNHIKGSFQEAKTNGFNHELLDRSFLFKRANDAILQGNHYPLFAVKANRFECGSVLLLVTTCHFVADGRSMFEFVRFWSELASGIESKSVPFDARHLFLCDEKPSKEAQEIIKLMKSFDQTPPKILAPIRRVRISIPCCAIAQLKAKVNSELQPNRWITTDDLMCALGWRALTRARRLGDAPTRLGRIVEFRSLLEPSLPPTAFGNIFSYVTPEAIPASKLLSSPLSKVAYSIREATSSLNAKNFHDFIIIFNGIELKQHPIGFDGSVFGSNLFCSSYTKFQPSRINFHNSPAITMTRAYYKEGALIPQPVCNGVYSCHLGASATYADAILIDPELSSLGFIVD